MKKLDAIITENKEVAKNYFKMVLEVSGGLGGEEVLPGQFVNIEIPGLYLRRPISVCNYEAGKLTLVYKPVGSGTEHMAGMKPGEKLNLLMPLGQGFDPAKAGERPVLIGGGAGSAPLYLLARAIKETNPKAQISVLLGFNEKAEVLLEVEFRALGANVTVYTVDGSYGTKGFAADGLDSLTQGAADAAGYTYFYACGPMPMFRAIEAKANGDGEYSFEERMGCGFGACMGCSHKTKNGYKRICKDGPVLSRGEILWD